MVAPLRMSTLGMARRHIPLRDCEGKQIPLMTCHTLMAKPSLVIPLAKHRRWETGRSGGMRWLGGLVVHDRNLSLEVFDALMVGNFAVS